MNETKFINYKFLKMKWVGTKVTVPGFEFWGSGFGV